MPIAALPKETSRAITSSLVLNDAVSVVKELIDNALDARANTISIEISSNTLDTIQVKDNGTGIGVEDRQLLCKRGCTSKIRSIEDLASIGGTFLGFRGEALASITELSGSITITTRVEGEIAGSALKYGGEGKLLSSSSAPHPVGSTVRVQDLLSNIPVRKQTALKTNSKTVNSIRKLMYGYAFARSDTRFSLKVLKSKDGKANWSFAPCQIDAPFSEVASKIVGKEVSAQCNEYAAQSESQETEGKKSLWTIRALVLNPSSDSTKSLTGEQYFSVDKRPVNAERGIMRDLSKLYKQYLRSACDRLAARSCPSKPFLYVRITCPRDSYDVNVESTKDELLFYMPLTLRSLFEGLLKEAYGNLEATGETATARRNKQTQEQSNDPSFDLLMARKPSLEVHPIQDVEQFDDNHTVKSHAAPQAAPVEPQMSVNMYAGSDEDISSPLDSSELVEENDTKHSDMTANNPWAIAKMNVVLSPKRMSATPSTHSALGRSGAPSISNNLPALSPSSSIPTNTQCTSLRHNLQLPSPVNSPRRPGSPYQNPGPPSQVLRRHGPRQDKCDEEAVTPPTSDPVPPRPSLLETWVEQAQSASQQALLEHRSGINLTQPLSQIWSMGQSSVRQGRVSLPTSTSGRSRQPDAVLQQRRLNQPFKTPFKRVSHHQIVGSTSEATNETIKGLDDLVPVATPVSPPDRSVSPAKQPSASSNQRDLDDILQFERQKRIAIAQQRKQVTQSIRNAPFLPQQPNRLEQNPTSSLSEGYPNHDAETQKAFNNRFGSTDQLTTPSLLPEPKTNNPHHNRYLAAIRDLNQQKSLSATGREEIGAPSPKAGDNAPNIPDIDPRGYLIHHNQLRDKQNQANAASTKKMGGLKIKKIKTTRLPFESIPVGEMTCNLSCTLNPPSMDLLASQAPELATRDEYMTAGEIGVVRWDQEPTAVEEWQDVLERLIATKFSGKQTTGDDEEPAFGIHLGEIIKNHIARCAK